MGHEESFCGDVLRLTSFLRVVEYIPERPARFGRRRQLDVRTEADNAPPNRPEQPTDISLNNNELKISAVQHVSPPLITNDSQPQREVLPNVVSEPPQKTYRCSSLNSVKNSRHLTLLPKDTIERGNVAAQKYVPSSLSPKRKKLIVYKAKKCKIDHRDKSFPTTRKRRLVNINELALVRTTTSDGLPNRSQDEESGSVIQVTEIDPIEDSQTASFQARPAVQPTVVRAQKQEPSRTHPPLLFAKSSWESTTNAGRATSGPKRKGSRALDGFIDLELQFFSQTIRKKNVKSRKRNSPSSDHKGLTLVSGALPRPETVPIQRLQPPEPLLSRINGSQSRALSLRTLAVDSSQPARIRMPSTAQLERQEAARIAHQLSVVAAPRRASTSSGSEAEDDATEGATGDDLHEVTSGEELVTEDDANSETSVNSPQDLFRNGSMTFSQNVFGSMQLDEVSHPQRRLYGSEIVSDESDGFWTQYGGLD